MENTTIFAAIDIETSGLDFGKCEILELAVVPLNPDFTVSAMPEFTARIRAERPEAAEEQAMRVNGLNLAEGDSRQKVRDDFLQWMKDNGIGKIVPVAHNLDFDLRFLAQAFPELSKAFSPHGRDSMRLALAINDIARRETGAERFAKVSLGALKDALDVAGEVSHRAFEDAKDAAAVYRRLTEMLTGNF